MSPATLQHLTHKSTVHHYNRGSIKIPAAQIQQLCQPIACCFRCQLLLVVLPTASDELYREVKTATDAALGIPSQCIDASSAGVGLGQTPRARLQYCEQLALKINAKMGGVNVRLAGDPQQVRGTHELS